MKPIISPSILSADFSKLGEECSVLESAGADELHIDVMDGHFVPNITIGPSVVSSLRKKTSLFFDTHLMISHPLQYIKSFVDAGSDRITFHLESSDDPMKVIDAISHYDLKAGIAIKPNTPIDTCYQYLPYLDSVLIMTVEPGFGGQKFLEEMLVKITSAKKYIDEKFLNINIQVDGGINLETIGNVAKSGANYFIAGSAILSQNNYNVAISSLRSAISQYFI